MDCHFWHLWGYFVFSLAKSGKSSSKNDEFFGCFEAIVPERWHKPHQIIYIENSYRSLVVSGKNRPHRWSKNFCRLASTTRFSVRIHTPDTHIRGTTKIHGYKRKCHWHRNECIWEETPGSRSSGAAKNYVYLQASMVPASQRQVCQENTNESALLVVCVFE